MMLIVDVFLYGALIAVTFYPLFHEVFIRPPGPYDGLF